MRDAVFREVASNMLIHREYLNPFPVKLIIEQSVVRTENSNKAHGFGPINPKDFSPFPKNPVMAKFFREIGFADELGSGVRKITEYGKKYGGEEPKLIEGDVFKIHINYPDFSAISKTKPKQSSRLESGLESELESGLAARILLSLIDKPLGNSEIAKSLGHKSTSGALHKQVRRLLDLGHIAMTLPNEPNSRLQKYRLTNSGEALIKG